MNSSTPIPVIISTLRSLNQVERDSIGEALEEYIEKHGPKRAWSQKVILEDMLPNLFWGTR